MPAIAVPELEIFTNETDFGRIEGSRKNRDSEDWEVKGRNNMPFTSLFRILRFVFGSSLLEEVREVRI